MLEKCKMSFRIDLYLIFQFWILMSIANKSTQIIDCGFPGISPLARLTISHGSRILGEWNYTNILANVNDTHWEFKKKAVAVYECQHPGQYILRGSQKRTCLWNGYWEQHVPYCEENIAFQTAAKVPGLQNTRWLTDGQMDPADPNDTTVKQVELNVKHPVERVVIHFEDFNEEDARDFKLIVGRDKECLQKQHANHRWIEFDCDNLSQSETALHFSMLSIANPPRIVEIQVFASSSQEKICRIPHIPSNGEILLLTNGSNPQTVIYKCSPGFELREPEQRHCIAGNWTGNGPICYRSSLTMDDPHKTRSYSPATTERTLPEDVDQEKDDMDRKERGFSSTEMTIPPENSEIPGEHFSSVLFYIIVSMMAVIICLLIYFLYKIRKSWNRYGSKSQLLDPPEQKPLQPDHFHEILLSSHHTASK